MLFFWDVADYFVINISSPNTKQVRELQTDKYLEDLVKKISTFQKQQNEKMGTQKPVLYKISPDNTEKDLVDISQVFNKFSVDGVIVTNTTNNHDELNSDFYNPLPKHFDKNDVSLNKTEVKKDDNKNFKKNKKKQINKNIKTNIKKNNKKLDDNVKSNNIENLDDKINSFKFKREYKINENWNVFIKDNKIYLCTNIDNQHRIMLSDILIDDKNNNPPDSWEDYF